MKKYTYLLLALLAFSSCHKNYFSGITNTKNWVIDAEPVYGFPVLNGGVNYHKMLDNIVADKGIEIVVDAEHILHLHTQDTIFPCTTICL